MFLSRQQYLIFRKSFSSSLSAEIVAYKTDNKVHKRGLSLHPLPQIWVTMAEVNHPRKTLPPKVWVYPSPWEPKKGTVATTETDIEWKQLLDMRLSRQRKPSTEGLADESWQGTAVAGNNRLNWELIKHRIYIAHLHLLHIKLPCIQKIMADAKWVLNTAGLSENGRGASSPYKTKQAAPHRVGGTGEGVDPGHLGLHWNWHFPKPES